MTGTVEVARLLRRPPSKIDAGRIFPHYVGSPGTGHTFDHPRTDVAAALIWEAVDRSRDLRYAAFVLASTYLDDPPFAVLVSPRCWTVADDVEEVPAAFDRHPDLAVVAVFLARVLAPMETLP